MNGSLALYYAAANKSESEQRLETLLSAEAGPTIRAIVRGRLRTQDADVDDVCAEVLVELMIRLRESKEGDADAIEDFEGYVAAAAYNACSRYVRRKNPLRWRLQNRVRYLLNHDARFALWEGAGRQRLCGFAEWRNRPSVDRTLVSARLEGLDKNLPLEDALTRIFRISLGPLDFHTAVDLAAQLAGLPMHVAEETKSIEAAPDGKPSAHTMIEQREFAEWLWNEVRCLPLPQRQALLLNLQDDGIHLLVLTGVASLRQIAAIVDIPAEEFAGLFHGLPLNDNTIATRLGITRQQVINLRMSARKRLANRLARRS